MEAAFRVGASQTMAAKQSKFLSQEPATSLSLLVRAKEHDEHAWESIVTIYGPLVYRLCRVKNIQAEDARDISQDVFRSAFRNIQSFRRDRPGDSFRAWLLKITSNKIIDYFRRQQQKPPAKGGTDMQTKIHQIPDLHWDSSTDGAVFDSTSNVIKRAIDMAKGDFATNTWEAFWQTTVEGRATEEVAEHLHLSKWSVYQAKSRVLRRIREDLNGMLD